MLELLRSLAGLPAHGQRIRFDDEAVSPGGRYGIRSRRFAHTLCRFGSRAHLCS
jgi:hypothetical protein